MAAKDDYIIVLDFLPHGKPSDRRAEPVAQGIGEKFFNLLEVAIKQGVTIKPKDRVYIGADKRDQVEYIRGRIANAELTNFAKNMVEEVVTSLVSADEKRFADFFNKSGPVTTRMHTLELLPGIGKKHMWAILNERKKKPFESFDDIQKRVEMMPDPKKMVVKRILEELEEKDAYRLFVGGGYI
jgi:putative nucleotide binding protein